MAEVVGWYQKLRATCKRRPVNVYVVRVLGGARGEWWDLHLISQEDQPQHLRVRLTRMEAQALYEQLGRGLTAPAGEEG